MRIVDRKTFLALPAGTLFSIYDPCSLQDLMIRDDLFGDFGDFWVVDLVSIDFEGSGGTEGWTAALERMEAGESSPPLDLDTVSRGHHHDVQLFAVWEAADVRALIARLRRALSDSEGLSALPPKDQLADILRDIVEAEHDEVMRHKRIDQPRWPRRRG